MKIHKLIDIFDCEEDLCNSLTVKDIKKMSKDWKNVTCLKCLDIKRRKEFTRRSK